MVRKKYFILESSIPVRLKRNNMECEVTSSKFFTAYIAVKIAGIAAPIIAVKNKTPCGDKCTNKP